MHDSTSTAQLQHEDEVVGELLELVDFVRHIGLCIIQFDVILLQILGLIIIPKVPSSWISHREAVYRTARGPPRVLWLSTK